ncbi:MAG: hypothetical protein J6W75_12770 [Bacteroidaceae bacterium]|nr:hypothetical protein [Bacteroidaceae bacterium]
MSIPVFSDVIAPSSKGRAGGGSAYAALWKTVEQQEQDGKPQSAYATVQQILSKAEADGNLGQMLSARLKAASLHQEWAPDSFFTDIHELERLRASATLPQVKAIYASILAEIYQNNQRRSQAKNLDLTSEDMKEWTWEQYDSAATANWQRSMEDLITLAAAKSKEWLPFVVQGEQSAYFRHDLLHILWQRFRNQRFNIWQHPEINLKAMCETVADLYRQQENREAELLIRLDGINFIEETDNRQDQPTPLSANSSPRIKHLLSLKESFGDLPLCTEVYLLLIQTDAPDSQKVAWAEEAIKKYPNYSRIGEVRNHLNELRRPIVSWTGNDVYYPGKTYTWKITAKNATAATFTVYRLKDNFKEDNLGKSKLSVNDFFKKNGTLVQKIDHSIEKKAPFETSEDSIVWKAPDVGLYALLYHATSNEKEATRKIVTNQYKLFRVTSLKTMTRFHSDQELEVIAVDAESGQPVNGATIDLFDEDYRTNKKIHLATSKTNEEGRAFFQELTENKNSRRIMVRTSKDNDHYLPDEQLWRNATTIPKEQTSTNLRLYTDRAIYRPGQTVHVSGIAYSQQHWDAKAVANQEYVLRLYDANGKEVEKRTVNTDEMGVLCTDFVLPEGRLPGMYRLQADYQSVYIRVEEYKRPTFEVKMDEAPALQWPQDSITLTGKALGYNGVPVREGRVTGHYRFTYPYFWWYRHDDSAPLPIDTVSTDEKGSFYVRVPLKDIPSEALRSGLCLVLDVEVLSAAGETREGSIRLPLCTTPLRLTITMNEQQDRERLTPPTFNLLTSTGKPAVGTIDWSIVPKNAPEGTQSLATGTLAAASADERLLSSIRTLPSGEYTLHAKAHAGQDTASAQHHFYVFGMTDIRLPRHTEEWLYCPTDTFDAKHPARLQVGSSFEDVALYYSLVGKKGIVKNELIRLSDELRIIEIPYLPEYGDGVSAHFAFVKGGTCYTMNKSLRLTLPDRELRWQWTTFRDRLHPGDKETWTLRLTLPDGTPAPANLMATIYDASLDQLTPHSWNFLVNRMHNLRYMPWSSRHFFQTGSAHQQLYFAMKDYPVKELSFDSFNEEWFSRLSFYAVLNSRTRMLRANSKGAVMEEFAASDAVLHEVVMTGYGEAPKMSTASAKMAGETVEKESEGSGSGEDDGGTVGNASAAVRTNFNETAAFMPRLHSNPKTGEVSLSFTLPESLTTWQLLGIAHTSDMMSANIQAQAIARKEMMARLYLPRFLRAGDQSQIRAVVQNLTETPLSGNTKLEVFNPETDKIILKQTLPFHSEANGECVLAFDYTPTEDVPVVAVRLTAETTPAKKRDAVFSDGEQHYLPILSAKEWMTESVEIAADGEGTFTTDLSSLFNNDSRTATQRRLTVEYTTHPIWNVVQALPALREPQNDDVLSLTSLLYGNSLAAHIAASTPRLKEMIELWKQQTANSRRANGSGTDVASALASPLSQNEELKQIILDETPWLREADSDNEHRAQLIDLFNENLVESRLSSTLERLTQRQQPDGGFGWFPGMRSSELMTRLVCLELTRLRTLTDNFVALPSTAKRQTNTILEKAFTFIAQENAKLIQEMKKAEAKGTTIHTGSLMHLHYVYITQLVGIKLTKDQQADVRYLLDHLKGSVASMGNMERAVAAVVLRTAGRKKDAQLYYDSMKEHLTTTSKHGTFFDYAGGSFTPTDHKVTIHTAAMEAVAELDGDETSLMHGLRRWLLQQKRTQMWESSICTVDAIYALLNNNTAELEETEKDRITLNYARRKVNVSATSADGKNTSPAALGYIKQTYHDGAAPKSITVQRNSKAEAWGAVYAQYLTPVKDASAHAAGLTIRRELSSTTPRLGDKFITRYVINADRDYEYVCLRADRAACAEPAEQVSGYRYQGGLGYYRSVHDAHTDYFFDHLPKGTYVLEETAFIDRTGHYTTGLVTLRCLYAPEYGGNTPAVELTVDKQ